MSLTVLGSPEAGFRLLRGQEQLTVGGPLQIITRALSEINTAAVAGLSLFAVHSGVIGGPAGAVAFPAPSGAGKSTMTAACLMAGFDYLSDEALILTDEGIVVPYPKPLSLSLKTRRLLGLGDGSVPGGELEEVAMTPADLGASIGPAQSELRHVVILERGEGRPSLVRQRSSETVSMLLRYSFNHYLRPEAAYRLACQVAESSEVWRLKLGHPVEAAELIAKRLTL
jgi:hypothetical protein